MNLLTLLGKIMLAGVVAVAGLTLIGKIRQRTARPPDPAAGAVAKDEKLSPQGFFLFSQAEAGNPRVIVMTPPNCPSQDAVRARALAAQLGQAGVPVEMRDRIGAEFTDPAEAERVSRHMNSAPMPLVIVRGWAKGAPSLDQVIAQYNRKP